MEEKTTEGNGIDSYEGMTPKEVSEFEKLIKKARKLDEKFMKSKLPIRLELSLNFSPKHHKWVDVTNNLFRTRLTRSNNTHDKNDPQTNQIGNPKEITLDQPTIITSIYDGFRKWRYEVENPMSMTLNKILEKYKDD